MTNRSIRRFSLSVIGAGLALALGGCATVTQGTAQSIEVKLQTSETTVGVPNGVPCTLSNGSGRWQLLAPGNVEIQRSSGPLMISCENEQWIMAETLTTESESKLGSSAAKGAGTGAGIGLVAGALATPTLLFTGPVLIVVGLVTGALYGGVAGTVADGASGAAFEYAPTVVVQLSPRPLTAPPVLAAR